MQVRLLMLSIVQAISIRKVTQNYVLKNLQSGHCNCQCLKWPRPNVSQLVIHGLPFKQRHVKYKFSYLEWRYPCLKVLFVCFYYFHVIWEVLENESRKWIFSSFYHYNWYCKYPSTNIWSLSFFENPFIYICWRFNASTTRYPST